MRSAEKFPITFYGGAKGGGKSKGLQLIMLYRRFQRPNTTGAIFRKSYPELEGNHIRPLFQAYPALRPYYNKTEKLLSLPNGSTLQFCHAGNEDDIDLYQGREFHDLAIDEIGQWTEPMFRKLLGSNRSAIEGVPARCLLTGNPGGIGHAWLKRIFIERRFNPRERPEDYNFIQALVTDNLALIENDPDYVYRLESEPNEALRKAFRFGDWDIFAGQYFQEISREVHLIKPFPIPEHWTRFGAYDFGFNHPAAFGWFAVDEDGNVYLYREFIKAGLRIDQYAQELNRFHDTPRLYPIVAGHDCWAKKAVMKESQPPTIAEEFRAHGIILRRAEIDRIQGAMRVRSYLAPRPKPKFYIFETCPITFDCIARMITDPDRPEDVLKVDSVEGDPNTGDDPFDMVRYGLMTRPALSESPKVAPAWGSDAWAKKEVERMEEAALEHFTKEHDPLDAFS